MAVPISEATQLDLDALLMCMCEYMCVCVLSYRAGTCCEGSVGEVGTTEVPEVWDHEEGISNVRRGLEKTSAVLLPPQR